MSRMPCWTEQAVNQRSAIAECISLSSPVYAALIFGRTHGFDLARDRPEHERVAPAAFPERHGLERVLACDHDYWRRRGNVTSVQPPATMATPSRVRKRSHSVHHRECETVAGTAADREGFITFIDAGAVERIATDQRKSVFTVGMRCVPAPSRTLKIVASPAFTFAAGPYNGTMKLSG